MWVDNASQIDILFYEPYADVIAEISKNPEYKPLTIGVFGIWGAGKSTLLNLIEQKILNGEDNEKNICVHINAWTFEGYEDAKIAVIECLLRELKEKAPDGFGKKIINLLKRLNYFKLTTKAIEIGAPIVAGIATGNPLPIVLAIPDTAVEIGKKISEVSSAVQTIHDDYMKEDTVQSDESLVNNIRKFREEFEETLNDSDIKNVIVLIDDLDRCQPDRIIETLEAIKLFLSVSKTVFVIAADENVIQYAIKKKYPPLDGFSVSLEKEYIEKIVQLPIYIPELSSKDIENYLMLLVAQEYCSEENFKKLIAELRCKKLIISEDVIDCAMLRELTKDYICTERISSFSTTAKIIEDIKGIISGNLKGNPRQAKRFLNTFITKGKLAELYYGKDEIDLTVLAKLLVLQKLNPTLFIELNEWNKKYTTINEDYHQMRLSLANNEKEEKNDDRFTAWKTPSIRKWVESKPDSLETIRLERYFYLTRENLQKAEVDISALSIASKEILDKIGASTAGTVPTVTEDMKNLSASDIDDVFKVLLPLIAQAKLKMYWVSGLYTKFESYRDSILSSLRVYEGKITLESVPQLKNMHKIDTKKFDDLFEAWKTEGKIDEKILETIRKE